MSWRMSRELYLLVGKEWPAEEYFVEVLATYASRIAEPEAEEGSRPGGPCVWRTCLAECGLELRQPARVFGQHSRSPAAPGLLRNPFCRAGGNLDSRW